jgi:hypothetical protein
MIIGMIKGRPTHSRMARQAVLDPPLCLASIRSSRMFCLVMASGPTSGVTAARTGAPVKALAP